MNLSCAFSVSAERLVLADSGVGARDAAESLRELAERTLLDDQGVVAPTPRSDALPVHAWRDWLNAKQGRRLVILSSGALSILQSEGTEGLASWAELTRCVLDLCQYTPERCLLLDAEEVAADPLAGLERIRDGAVFELKACPPGWHEHQADRSLGHWLAEQCLDGVPTMRILESERLATCTPLFLVSDEVSDATGADRWLNAWRNWQALRAADSLAAAQLADRLKAARGAAEQALAALYESGSREEDLRRLIAQLEHRLEEHTRAHQLLTHEVEALRQGRDELSERLEAVLADREAVQAQLQQARARQDDLSEQLEVQSQEARRWAQRCSAQEQSREEALLQLHDASALALVLQSELQRSQQQSGQIHSVLTHEVEALRQGRDELSERLEAVLADREAVQAQLQQARARQDDLSEQLEVQSQEARRWAQRCSAQEQSREEALLQLHDATAFVLAAQGEMDRLRAIARTPVGPLSPAILEVASERLEAPHEELRVLVRDVVTPTGKRALLEVRLVRHHGRVGLALLADDPDDRVTGQWWTDGEEGGRPFMLLLPSDAGHAQRLEGLGATDWQFVRRVARALDFHLTAVTQVTGVWSEIARRLSDELSAMPLRLRYDGFEVTAGLAGEPSELTLNRVVFGEVERARVRLRWSLQTHDDGVADLRILLEDGAPPLLLSWPFSNASGWARDHAIPVAAQRSSERRQWWAALNRQDREVVLGLLDALMTAAERFDQISGDASSVQESVREWRRQAHTDLRQLRWRRAANRLMHRL